MDTDLNKAKQWIEEADALLISASNGLSFAEGYNIFADNEVFKAYFQKFRDKYGISSILQGMFYNYPTPAERQSFFATLKKYMITDYQGSAVFADLKELVGDKEYFIVTSNGDTHFQLNGFAEEKMFEVEGNIINIDDVCPVIMQQRQRFLEFIQKNATKKLVNIELGIGRNNNLIKAPLMQLVAEQPTYKYITLNLPAEINVSASIGERGIGLAGPLEKTLKELVK